MFNINARGQFFVAREAYKHLSIVGRIIRKGLHNRTGHGSAKHTVYSGFKGAIETFVRCMAIDAGEEKITGQAESVESVMHG